MGAQPSSLTDTVHPRPSPPSPLQQKHHRHRPARKWRKKGKEARPPLQRLRQLIQNHAGSFQALAVESLAAGSRPLKLPSPVLRPALGVRALSMLKPKPLKWVNRDPKWQLQGEVHWGSTYLIPW